MHFKTIKRDEVLVNLEQAKNKKEQKKILCDLLECKPEELDELIKKLENEREDRKLQEKADMKKMASKVAKDEQLTEVSAYANYLEEENYRLIKEKMALIRICKNLFELVDELKVSLKERFEA